MFRGIGSFLLICAAAKAQGLYGNGWSARSAATGGTFVEGDATLALAVNPAGLARLSARSLDLHVNLLGAQGSFRNSVDSNGTLRNGFGVLPFAAVAVPVGKSRWTVGAAVLPETMMSGTWRYVDAPGTAGASWGLRDHKSAILAARGAFGFGVDLGRGWALGGTANVVYNQNTLRTPYIFQFHPALRGLKTALDLSATGYGWSGTIGVLARPHKSLDFGLAYKTRTAITTHGVAHGTLDRQFEAAGLAARPDYRYDAQVDNTLPQSIVASFNWRANSRLKLLAQMDWINWSRAFRSLPVTLTNGNNADINGLLGSNRIVDGVPLDWRDQYVWRFGMETPVTDAIAFRAGTFFTQNPVPGSTLTPLTGAIVKSAISTGLGYKRGRWSWDAAYAFNPPTTARVGQSSLAAGEYSNSQVRVAMHSLILSGSLRF
jgi:long-subunit fatty acid transport protein